MFSKGEVVELKSGGPKMTIREINSSQSLTCNWFEGAECKVYTFEAHQLQRVTN